MPGFVLMKAFENSPARYDGAMGLLTLGRIDSLKREIVAAVSGKDSRVLELGCGTGNLAVEMARAGARVLAIDSSEAMLDVARKRAGAVGTDDAVEFRHLSVMEIDTLPKHEFDCVVGTLVLSELSDDEIEFVLREARERLRPGGQLLIGDEVTPRGHVRRLLYGLLRLPFRLLTFLVGMAQSLTSGGRMRRLLFFLIELPLMLLVFFVSPPPSRPLGNVEERIRNAGFRPAGIRRYLGGTLQLIRFEAD